MKLNHCLLGAAVAALLIGCDHASQPTADSSDKSAPTLKDQATDALHSASSAIVAGKDEFVAASEKQLKNLDAKIDELSKKSAEYKDDAKVQADKALAALRDERAVAAKKYDELKNSTRETWDQTKAAFSSAWEALQKDYENAKSKFQ